ncbi:MAG TPA: MtnX-like HAD-IB family phosphatase [Candidatus Thermoplasmatota archaeon]|nr:MtnX-like HAD-IB family phosphatase [Candidatus Thermoplasmatota archaeon]
MARRLRVFLDYDDTITVGGVGDFLIEDLGDGSHLELWRSYMEGRLTLKELDARQYTLIQATEQEMAAYVAKKARVRDGFHELLQFCRSHEVPVAIITGGLENYVKPLLEREGVTGIPVFGNRVRFGGPRGHPVAVEMPNASPRPEFCDYCACCKTFVMARLREHPDEEFVFVGDGSTDFCPSTFARHVFARRRLLRYCRENGVAHTPFETFHEVRAGLARLLGVENP